MLFVPATFYFLAVKPGAPTSFLAPELQLIQAMFLTLQRLFGDLDDPLLEPIKGGERDVPVLKLWDRYLGMRND